VGVVVEQIGDQAERLGGGLPVQLDGEVSDGLCTEAQAELKE
jgi:hypothetical protein